MPANTLQALCSSNRSLLRQKLGLIHSLVEKLGKEQAKAVYKEPCKVVKASIGQHIRHSLDHIDRAVTAVSDTSNNKAKVVIHYDTRQRGGPDEWDVEAAIERIGRIDKAVQKISSSSKYIPLHGSVDACFMLSGDDSTEFMLPSTLARELAFAAHHAIHHMAMVKIIAESDSVGLSESDMPHNFGRAPSTISFHRTH
jgi:hypothetical protein